MEQYSIRGIADIERIEQVPLEQRGIPASTYEMIRDQAQRTPERIALTFFQNGEQYDKPLDFSYQQLLGGIHRTANMLRDLGVGPDDVVSLLLPNLPQTQFAIWGGQACGVVNPINPMLEAEVIGQIMAAAKTKVLIALGDVPGSDIWPKVEKLRSMLPELKVVLRVLGPPTTAEGVLDFDEQLGRYDAQGLSFERSIDPQDLCALFHTGGTTGTPKLAKHTHAMETYIAWAVGVMAGFDCDSSMICGLPLFHVNAVLATGLAPYAVGARVVLAGAAGYRDRTLIGNFYKIVERYRATFFSGVPTVYAGLLQVPAAGIDISSLRYAICGAAPMPIELFRNFEAATGMKILEGYGLTEATLVSSINPRDGERKVGSIGIRLPYQPMKCVKLDENGVFQRDCDDDEIGTIVIKGPNVFPGYTDEAYNETCWVAQDWLNTGDLGRRDAEGYFWITGREKDLIIRGGHNIDPSMIENALAKIPGVSLVAAIGRPDPYAGEVPVAYVEPEQGVALTSDELMKRAGELIGERAAVPKEIVVLESLPKTAVGKLFKPALRWDAVRRVYQRELGALGEMVQSCKVEVGEDKIHGMLATIRVVAADEPEQAVESKIKQALANYTVRYRVEWKSA
ncbi:MAG: acyl-CoA synthetase [Candidatus Alcyoniella australis]|nr:acyl-CoA synthetase [Candidatus Alcyoniella australis]